MIPVKDTRARWLLALVVASTITAFSPALEAGFVNWDDESNLLLNAHWRGLGWAQWRWAFSTVLNGHYHPLTWLSYGLDFALWGLRPAGYHLTNVLLHALNAALLFAIARRLFLPHRDAALGAAAAALLFALHPLRAESVAWVSERRDVLSGAFYLGTVLLYLQGRLRAALLCFSASLLSKAMGVTLPLALLILDFHPLGRLRAKAERRKALLEKLPFLALAALATALGFIAEIPVGAARSLAETPLLERIAVASYGTVFYILKTAAPTGLSHLYPRPASASLAQWPYCGALAASLGLLALGLWALRRRPALAASLLFYAASLGPVVGLVQFGPHLVADRFSYIPCLGFALLAGGALRGRGRPLRAAAAALAVALGAASYRQSGFWRDSRALWERAAAADPGNWVAWNYLGLLALERGSPAEAAGHFEVALAIKPDYGAAHNNLGNALFALGRVERSLKRYREAARLSPGHEAVHYNIAKALLKLGRRRDAALHLELERRHLGPRTMLPPP